jgi:hypothetical protein
MRKDAFVKAILIFVEIIIGGTFIAHVNSFFTFVMSFVVIGLTPPDFPLDTTFVPIVFLVAGYYASMLISSYAILSINRIPIDRGTHITIWVGAAAGLVSYYGMSNYMSSNSLPVGLESLIAGTGTNAIIVSLGTFLRKANRKLLTRT